jgi:hypothetical protein
LGDFVALVIGRTVVSAVAQPAAAVVVLARDEAVATERAMAREIVCENASGTVLEGDQTSWCALTVQRHG